jgi:flagellum-specific ATP synthase
MMARYTQADVIVVGLIGERGREVKEFIEDILGEEGRAVPWSWPRRRMRHRCCACRAPPTRRRGRALSGPGQACAAADGFADPLRDGAARDCTGDRRAARHQGLSAICFAKLPQLVERSGNGLNGVGSITAFYTVLSEGDDQQDPIADAARAILDGHIVLSPGPGRGRPFPGHRHRAIGVPRDAQRGVERSLRLHRR